MNKKHFTIFFLLSLPFFTFLEREFFGVFLLINFTVLFFSKKRSTGLILFIYLVSLILFKLDVYGYYFLLNFFILFFCFFDGIEFSKKQVKKFKIASFTIVLIHLLLAPSAQLAFFTVMITVFLWDPNFKKNLPWILLVFIISDITGSRTSSLSMLVYSIFKISPNISNYISKNYLKVFIALTLTMSSFYYIISIENEYEALLYEYDPRLVIASLFFENVNTQELILGTASINSWNNSNTINLLNFDKWQYHHNSFITILSFAGILGLLIFLYLINNVIKSSTNINFRYFFALFPIALFFDNFLFYPMICLSIVLFSKTQIKNHEKYFN